MLQVIYTDISRERFIDLKKYIRDLSPTRQHKVNCFKFEKDKVRSIISELLLKYALKKYFNVNLEDCEICFNVYGKPYIYYGANLKFNLSHSGDIVICSISNHNMGVDVEENTSLSLDTVINCLHKEEKVQLNNFALKDRIKLFYDFWVLKESYLKYLGIGLNYPVEKIGFEIKNEKVSLISGLDNEHNPFFSLLNISDCYSAAICCENKEEIKIEIVESDILKSALLK